MSKTKILTTVLLIQTVFAGSLILSKLVRADTSPAAILTGRVSSQAEGSMEGVLVTAKKDGSAIAVTVVSDDQGRYAFPSGRLDSGNYRIKIRAVGYELDDPGIVQVEVKNPVRLDLTLHKAKDLTSQLTGAEWLMSAPGNYDQKMFGGFCIQCHSLDRVFRSKFDAAGFLPVLERMMNYDPASLVEPQNDVFKPVLGPNARVRGPEAIVSSSQGLPAKEVAEYLSSINLSSSKDGKWAYELKTLPRPKGRDTKVIFTEYDLPRRDVQAHDCVVDGEGMVWYNDISGGYLGRLNPKTGEIKEWKTPIVKAGAIEGARDIEVDREGNVWLGMKHQDAIAKFDPKTEKFTTWSAPEKPKGECCAVILSPDGTVWLGKNYQLDPKTGEIMIYKVTAPDGYGMAFNSKGDMYLADLFGHQIGEFIPKTGQSKVYPAPRKSGPRRGEIDSQDRFWYGLYYSGKIGMFDTKTKELKEWPIPGVEYSGCYYAMADKKGDVWCGSELTDAAYRLNPGTGQVTSYLLPTLEANIQRINVDSSTTPVTVWVSEAHQRKIVKIEPVD